MKITVADYVAQFLVSRGVRDLFAISGASDLRLLDAIHRHPELQYICPHHEQAGVMAAITYHRLSGRPGVMLCTAGPGASNTVTGLASAYLDSIPCFVISGQEKSEFLDPRLPLRGKGVQGLDMLSMVKPVTKYAFSLKDAQDIRYELERSFYEAYAGRPGPVWIELPQDLQTILVEPESLRSFSPPDASMDTDFQAKAKETLALLRQAKRPLLWVGNGVRLSGAVSEFQQLLQHWGVPSLVAWNSVDLVPNDHPLYAGRAGTYGQRAANFALQNCDLLITLGTRLAIPQRGYNDSEFARAAKKVICEIDPVELSKFKMPIEVPVLGNVAHFIRALWLESQNTQFHFQPWVDQCQAWQRKYPTCPDDWRKSPAGEVNSYHFIDRLSAQLTPNDVVCTDMGTSLTCTHAAIQIKAGQRVVTSTGLGEMGFGLPGAIGACIGNGRKPTVFIGVEGSLMMNLQELQTVIHEKLPIKIFILNNNGYLTIKHTERALGFGDRLSGCTTDSGVSFPDLEKVAQAFGYPFVRIDDAANVDPLIQKVLTTQGPVFCEIKMPSDQFLGPKSAVKTRADGTLYSPPLEDLFPFLPRDEFQANMLIPTLPE